MASNDPAMIDLGYEREDHDFYPTEEWVTLAAVEFMRDELGWQDCPIWECAAGDGAMIDPLMRLGTVYATDLVDRGSKLVASGKDFLKTHHMPTDISLIVTNPPYTLAHEFVEHALRLTSHRFGGVAMLLRNEWDCAAERQSLLRDHQAYTAKLVLTSRPRWIRGSKGSPRHNYAWYFWDWDHDPDTHPSISYSKSKTYYK